MNIENIQSLIANGLIADGSQIDPSKTFVQVGVYQPGNRQIGAGNANAYKSYAMALDQIMSAGGLTLANNGLTVVGGTTVELGGTLIHDTQIDIAGFHQLFSNGVYPLFYLDPSKNWIGMGTNSPTAMLDIVPTGSGTKGVRVRTAAAQDAIISMATNSAVTDRMKLYVDNTLQTTNLYTTNSDTIFWNGNGLAQTKTLTLFTNTTAQFESNLGVNGGLDPAYALTIASKATGAIRMYNSAFANMLTVTDASLYNFSTATRIGIGAVATAVNTLFIEAFSALTTDYSLSIASVGSISTYFAINNVGNVGIGQVPSVVKVDIVNDSVNPIFRLRSNTFIFDDHLRVDNDGGFRSTSSNAFGTGGIGTLFMDHAVNTLSANGQPYLYYTNAGGANVHGIIGGSAGLVDPAYRLKIYQSTTASVLQLISVGAVALNDGFDYTVYNANISSTGIITNAGSGTTYKVGINLDIINGDVNRAINIENGLIRVVKANQPLYATLTSGEFYYDTAANILANGDFVVGMKA